MKYFLFGLLFCFIILCSLPSAIVVANDSLTDYDVALQTAKEEKKNVLLVFGLHDCKYCDILKKDLLDLDIANDYVVCILDSRSNKRLTGSMKIKKWPTSIVITVGKEVQGEVSRLVGYTNKVDYQLWLQKHAGFFGQSDGVCGCDCDENCVCRKDGICTCCGDKKCDCKK